MATFPIRFTGINRAMAALGIGPRRSRVEIDGEVVHIRMGWAFRLRFDRSNVASAERDTGRVGGWGVHGWRGVWLVNGSSKGLVRIDLTQPAKGRVIGWPVNVRTVRVSVDDPAALIAALV
jgi:hypothetical protein